MKYKEYLLFLFVVLFDQLTKFSVKSNLMQNDSLPVIQNFFSITYVRNTGVSFGLFKGNNMLFMLVAIIIFGFFAYTYFKNRKYGLQLALICGGIIGNLIDRIFLGSVVDFMDFKIWPIFNAADTAVFIGVIWLIILLVKNKDDLF